MVICRRVFNFNEIATWFDRLTMSGCAPRNDRASFDKLGMILRQAQDERKVLAMAGVADFTLTPTLSHRGLTGVCKGLNWVGT